MAQTFGTGAVFCVGSGPEAGKRDGGPGLLRQSLGGLGHFGEPGEHPRSGD
jgi:hypothetical protein